MIATIGALLAFLASVMWNVLIAFVVFCVICIILSYIFEDEYSTNYKKISKKDQAASKEFDKIFSLGHDTRWPGPIKDIN